jgi:predicted transcriptional regulator
MKTNPVTTQLLHNAVLISLLAKGGKAEPSQVYGAVEAQLPRRLTVKAAKNLPYSVRWTRKSLVTMGLISSKVRGEWSLTAKGRKAALALLK